MFLFPLRTIMEVNMQKWEYLMIEVKKLNSFISKVSVFSNDKLVLSNSKRSDFREYLNKLGDDGWEMVGVESEIIYFKRLKSN